MFYLVVLKPTVPRRYAVIKARITLTESGESSVMSRISHQMNPSTLFVKPEGRLSIFHALLHWPVSRLLRRASARHVQAQRKPLVVFAFDHIAHQINLKGVYEGQELDTFFAWMGQHHADLFEGVALDVGANIGNHSLYFSDYFKKVYSFEPNPRTHKVLLINAALASNIQCFEIGLSDVSKQALMDVNPTNCGGASVTDHGSALAQTIRLETLDALCAEQGQFNEAPIKLLKIDIEGHEYKALCGAEQVIRRHQPVILFEQHPHDFEAGRSRVIDLLRSYGYQKFAAIETQPCPPGPLGPFLGKLYSITGALLTGGAMSVVLKEKIETGFYPFIIAIPDWIELTDTHAA